MASIVCTAPMKWQGWQFNGRYKIFLGGSIASGQAEEWQKKVIKSLEPFDNAFLFNPRRALWNVDPSEKELRAQINWELEAQEKSDFCMYYIDPTTYSPITLMELGAFSSKATVAMPAGFWREDNVKVFCERYHVPLVDSLEELIGVMKVKLQRNG